MKDVLYRKRKSGVSQKILSLGKMYSFGKWLMLYQQRKSDTFTTGKEATYYSPAETNEGLIDKKS